MYTTVNGVRIHYEVCGEGPPVLILHGWMAGIEAMRSVMAAVAQMGMHAVALDFPGMSDACEEPPAAWGVPEYADVTRAFMEQQGLFGADVVCHSFGGRVVISLASDDPTLFRRIVMIGAAGVRPKRGFKWYIRTYKYKVGKRLAKIPWINRQLHLSEKQKSAGSEDYRALRSDRMREVFVKVVNLDLTNRLSHIQNETLLVWGAEDTSSPLYMAKTMERLIPNAGLVVFEGAGHFCYAEQYSRFCAVLRAYFFPKKA